MQSSTYTTDAHTQADGRRFVRETHIDATGKAHMKVYRAPAGWGTAEYDAHLAESAARIDAALAEAEALALLEQG